jgi:hypothetical protein
VLIDKNVGGEVGYCSATVTVMEVFRITISIFGLFLASPFYKMLSQDVIKAITTAKFLCFMSDKGRKAAFQACLRKDCFWPRLCKNVM